MTVLLGKVLLETLGQALLCPLHTLKQDESSRRGMCSDSSLTSAASEAHKERKGVCWGYQTALNTLSEGLCQCPFASCKRTSNEFAPWKGKYGFRQQFLCRHFGRRLIGQVNIKQMRPNVEPFPEGCRNYQLPEDLKYCLEKMHWPT